MGKTDEVYALSNFDPFSEAFVLSRGLVGDRRGVQKLISPIYKQNYYLKTGECLDDATVSISVYLVRVLAGQVQAQAASSSSKIA